MTMKGYSAFPKAFLQSPHQIVLCHMQYTRCGEGVLPSVKMQLVYSTAQADWDTHSPEEGLRTEWLKQWDENNKRLNESVFNSYNSSIKK